MEITRRVDEKGNAIFETAKRIIFIDLEKVEKLTGVSVYLLHRNYNKSTKRELSFGTDGIALYYRTGGRRTVKDQGFLRAYDGTVILPIGKLAGKKSKAAVKKAILKVLAHEVNHLANKKPKRKWWNIFYKLDRLIIPLAIMVWGLIALQALDELSLIALPEVIFLLTLPLGALLLLLSIPHLWGSGERMAEKFAKQAIKSPEWLEVIKVSDVSKYK